jgi:hypothetical protein
MEIRPNIRTKGRNSRHSVKKILVGAKLSLPSYTFYRTGIAAVLIFKLILIFDNERINVECYVRRC